MALLVRVCPVPDTLDLNISSPRRVTGHSSYHDPKSGVLLCKFRPTARDDLHRRPQKRRRRAIDAGMLSRRTTQRPPAVQLRRLQESEQSLSVFLLSRLGTLTCHGCSPAQPFASLRRSPPWPILPRPSPLPPPFIARLRQEPSSSAVCILYMTLRRPQASLDSAGAHIHAVEYPGSG